MSGVTEIYICKNGQALKEGKLELSHSIEDRDAAEADALRRCKIDGAIERIAYYVVSESGSFRNIFTYTNPNAGKKIANVRDGAGQIGMRRLELLDRRRQAFQRMLLQFRKL